MHPPNTGDSSFHCSCGISLYRLFPADFVLIGGPARPACLSPHQSVRFPDRCDWEQRQSAFLEVAVFISVCQCRTGTVNRGDYAAASEDGPRTEGEFKVSRTNFRTSCAISAYESSLSAMLARWRRLMHLHVLSL
jgi:hypothetical protein